jgi:hypothetical protein
MTVTIRLSYPPSKLGQTRGNWRVKAGLVKKWRTKWGWELKRFQPSLKGKTQFKISFAPPDNRRRDVTNCQMALKHGIDALADIVGLDDSNFTVIWHPDFLKPLPNGAVFVEVLN